MEAGRPEISREARADSWNARGHLGNLFKPYHEALLVSKEKPNRMGPALVKAPHIVVPELVRISCASDQTAPSGESRPGYTPVPSYIESGGGRTKGIFG